MNQTNFYMKTATTATDESLESLESLEPLKRSGVEFDLFSSDVLMHSSYSSCQTRTFDPDITHQQIEWVLGKACARCFFMILSVKQLSIAIFTSCQTCQEDSTGSTAVTFDEVWANLEADDWHDWHMNSWPWPLGDRIFRSILGE